MWVLWGMTPSVWTTNGGDSSCQSCRVWSSARRNGKLGIENIFLRKYWSLLQWRLLLMPCSHQVSRWFFKMWWTFWNKGARVEEELFLLLSMEAPFFKSFYSWRSNHSWAVLKGFWHRWTLNEVWRFWACPLSTTVKYCLKLIWLHWFWCINPCVVKSFQTATKVSRISTKSECMCTRGIGSTLVIGLL